MAVGFGVGVAAAVGVGVGLGARVGVAVMTRGDGTEAGELATSAALATALGAGLTGAELAGPALGAAALVTAGEPTAAVDPADDGWLLVHAASAATQATATTQRAGVGLVVRSRLAMDPG